MGGRGSPGLIWVLITGCTVSTPPATQDSQVQRILADGRYQWVSLNTVTARVHFPEGSYAQARQGVLLQRAERALADVLLRLGELEFTEVPDLFYVDDRSDVAVLTGASATGYSYFDDAAVVLVFNEEWRPFERHELAHVVTLGTWPRPWGMAVVEGVATYVEGVCGGFANGRVTRSILNRNGPIPLETLTTDFRGQDDLLAYLQAAAIVEYLVENEGPEVVRKLWARGLQAAPSLVGETVQEFEHSLQGWLNSSYDSLPDGALERIRGDGCGISALQSIMAP